MLSLWGWERGRDGGGSVLKAAQCYLKIVYVSIKYRSKINQSYIYIYIYIYVHKTITVIIAMYFLLHVRIHQHVHVQMCYCSVTSR